MYVIGKCALAYQLNALGIISSTQLGQNSICERMLIELYEKCGDAIAQQYAGSQLVHRVDTYGKNSFAQTHMAKSRDMLHTISRYYSNAFADADKQSGINIFLGVFEPTLWHPLALGDLETDVYLHNKFILEPWKLRPTNYIEWINKSVFKCLPAAYEQENKSLDSMAYVEAIKCGSKEDQARINEFDNFYKPFELTALHETFYLNILNTSRVVSTYNNSSATSIGGNLISMFDPFKSRMGKKSSISAENTKGSPLRSVSVSGSTDEDLTDTDSASVNNFEHATIKPSNSKEKIKAVRQFAKTNQKDEQLFVEISGQSLILYKKYANDSINLNVSKDDPSQTQSTTSLDSLDTTTKITTIESKYKQNHFYQQNRIKNDVNDSAINITTTSADPIKAVSEKSLSIYLAHIKVGKSQGEEPSDSSYKLYETFVSKNSSRFI
jgi:hypothetical protein